jgi:SNF2 family DNA or RNA helicase
MVEWCDTVVKAQGAQAVIFTFYAGAVLPYLQEALEEAKYSVSINHGGMSSVARGESQRRFKAGETQIFLTSDAGQKGINLPEATYLLHYERPLTHANFVQRSNRIHRIDSLKESVFIYSLCAADTIEEGLYDLGLRRNEWSDKLIGDNDIDNENFITATDRKQLLKIGKKMVA